MAVVMTTIGLFGVIAYMVSQRTHEIGVRMALGARRADVLKLVMGQGMRLTGIGLGIGLCVALGAARLLAPLLYGIGANDPATMAAVAAGLAADCTHSMLSARAKGHARGSIGGSPVRVSG